MPLETVTLLRAKHGRACKTITPSHTKNYDHTKYWFYEPVPINGLDDFATLLSTIETDDRTVIIRGQPKRAIAPGALTVRQKAVFESRSLRLVCFDIDHLQAPDGMSPISDEAIEFAVQLLPPAFHTASYAAQFSAKAGLRGQAIKAHFWFALREPQTDKAMRAWAESTNGLIDPALFNPIQIHYTGNPHFEGGAIDPFNGGSRVRYVRKASQFADFEPPTAAVTIRTAGETAISEIVTNGEGEAVDGREALLFKIRWKILNDSKRPLTFDDFANRVWAEFHRKAVLGPTAESANSYDFERIASSCVADWEKHGKVISIPPNKTVSLPEAEALVRKSVRDAITGGKIAIKVTPGVGKSRTAAEELAHLAGRNIEIYAPTNAQQQEWAERTGGRVILGRNKETCRKHNEVKALQTLGVTADAALCKGKLGGAGKCEHFETCPYQVQFHEIGPGIRIYSHAHLATPRHKRLEQPDIVAIDEGFLSSAIEIEKFGLSDLRTVAVSVSNSWTLGQSSVERDAAYEVISAVLQALNASGPLLDRLTERGVTAEALRDAAKIVSKVTPLLALRAGESVAALTARVKQRQRASFVLVTRLFRALAKELETGRRDVHCIMPTDNGFLFCHRRALERLEGAERVLLLDADLERENVLPFFSDIEVREIECAQNLHIEQVCDLSFSRAWLGLRDESPNEKRMNELCDRIRPLLGGRPLIVTYKALILHLRERLPVKCRFAHFGNLRGTNAYEDCDCVVVIGRQFPSTAAIEAQARALHSDSSEPLNFETVAHWHAAAPDTALPSLDYVDGRLHALMSAQREGEQRQAVGRSRAVRSPTMKKAYLFSNQPVRGLKPNRLVKYERSKAADIFLRLGGWLPLNPKLLVKFAGGYFPKGEEQASKWRDTVQDPFPLYSYIVRRGLEGGAPILTHGRIPGSKGARKFRIWVDPLLHPHPEYSVAAKANLVVDPLPWAEAPRSALPEELKIPGFEVVCLKGQLQSNIVKWAYRAALARGEKSFCPAAPIPAIPANCNTPPMVCLPGGSFGLAA